MSYAASTLSRAATIVLPLLAVAIVAALLVVRPTTSTAGAPGEVLVVGDSITAQGSGALQAKRPGWEIDARSGRPVSQLPLRLAARLERGPAPSVVVVALGSNAVADWDLADYRAALELVDPHTHVVLVTTWRDPRQWGETRPERHRAAIQAVYSGWMWQIAAERPHTCVADWRSLAASGRGLLSDGVHLTDAGKRHWADLLVRSVQRCTAPTSSEKHT